MFVGSPSPSLCFCFTLPAIHRGLRPRRSRKINTGFLNTPGCTLIPRSNSGFWRKGNLLRFLFWHRTFLTVLLNLRVAENLQKHVFWRWPMDSLRPTLFWHFVEPLCLLKKRRKKNRLSAFKNQIFTLKIWVFGFP